MKSHGVAPPAAGCIDPVTSNVNVEECERVPLVPVIVMRKMPGREKVQERSGLIGGVVCAGVIEHSVALTDQEIGFPK